MTVDFIANGYRIESRLEGVALIFNRGPDNVAILMPRHGLPGLNDLIEAEIRKGKEAMG